MSFKTPNQDRGAAAQLCTRPKGYLALIALAVWLPAIGNAVTLTVSPSTISNSYTGTFSIQITGLTNGETVLLQRFLDATGNGAVDTGEPMVQSVRFTDGQLPTFGGVRNGNMPGDEDLSANGQISATLGFSRGPEFSRGAGSQVFRVSSPNGRFAPVQQVVTVTQTAYPQQITGTVSNATGPLPYSFVGALVQSGQDQEFAGGTTADATGHFSLAVTNGTYVVVAFQPGYLGNFGTAPLVTVSGANTNVSVVLSSGSVTVSGTATDSVGGNGLAGMQFFVSSSLGDYTVVFTDALGTFSAMLAPGQWEMDPSDSSLQVAGYLRAGKTQLNVSTANITGVNIPLTHATGMVYGTLKDDLGNALANVRLWASDSGNVFQSSAYTGPGGGFFLATTNGTWYVGADSSNSGMPAGYILQQVQVSVGGNQAFQTNLVARRSTAWLAGRVVDGNHNPLGSAQIMAFTGNNINVQAQTAGDGSFALAVWGGNWSLSLETGSAAAHNVVAPQLSCAVNDGGAISNIDYVCPIATRSISGWVRNATNGPIANVNIFAGASINGTNYGAGARTDVNGNYYLPVAPGSWGVGVDSQGLQQLGYPSVGILNADTTSANQTVNFVVGGAPPGALSFRHTLGIVGEFGTAATPDVIFPVSIKNYRAIYMALGDTNPPGADLVLFTGPPGSGLTNTPADSGFGAVQDGTNVYYMSPPVRNSTAPGGNWTITYRGSAVNLIVPDPQANSRIAVPVPTVNVSGDLLRSLTWVYRDRNGSPYAGTPSFVRTNRIDILDQNGGLVLAAFTPSALAYTYPAGYLQNWSTLGILRVNYYDDLGNQYFVGFSESNPSLTSAVRLSANRCQFLLNGPAGVNYSIQYKTNLNAVVWDTLLVTNSLTSPITIIDPAATNSSRFYRVQVGP